MKTMRLILFVGLAISAVTQAKLPTPPTLPSLKGRRVLIVIAFQKFKDKEFMHSMKTLKRLGAEITVGSTQEGRARGVGGTKIHVDTILSQTSAANYDGIVFIGGPGCRTELWNNEDALRLAREGAKKKLILGAICYGPGILAKAGLLRGHTAAVFRDHHTRALFREAGARISPQHVIVDGRIVTADGPDAAKAFADKYAQTLGAATRTLH